MLETVSTSAQDGAKRLLAEYLSESETALELSVAPRTLREWRQKGEGPSYVKIARQVWYPRAGIAAWLKANERQPVRAGRKAA